MVPSTPTERSMIASIAAHESWARCNNRSARTAKAREAALDRFEREVDPQGTLPPAERARRAEHARKAYFQRLALKSAQSRRRAKEARATAVQLENDARAAESELAGGAGR